MAWSSEFLRRLSATPVRPQFRFETFDLGTGAGNTPGSPSSTAEIAGFSASSAGMQAVSWTPTASGFNVLIGVENPGALLGYLKRGALCRVRCAIGTTAAAQWNTIAIGRIMDVNGVPPEIVVQCTDFLAALGSRLTVTPAELPLFSDAANTTTLTSDYTAGDASLAVSATSGFSKESGGATVGLLQVTPTSGSPFFLTWSSKTGSSFTVSTSGVLGTTAVDAVTGDTVTHYPYIVDHPLRIARKVLTSTGSGTNGGFDTLPKSWGYGIPAEFIDGDDIARYVTASTPSSGTANWQAYVTEPQNDGGSWLRGLLSPAGMFIVSRQGQISARCAVACYTPPAALEPEIVITDQDIAEVVSHSRFDTSIAAQGAGIRVKGPTTQQTSKRTQIATLPAVEVVSYELPYLGRANEALQLEQVRDRLLHWSASVPEKITIICAGLRLAGLSPGDLVRLTCRKVVGRIEGEGGFYRLRRCMVATVAPDFVAAEVRLELLAPTPPDNNYD